MASRCSNCGATGCSGSCLAFTDPEALKGSMILGLRDMVDQSRDLYTQLGARSYRVLVVRTMWSGGERGAGVEGVISETPILPTPMVANVESLMNDMNPVGVEESGTVKVSEISIRYTENDLMGLDTDGTAIPDDQNVYWEISTQGMPGVDQGPRRRFVVKSPPAYDALNLQWTISLTRTAGDRLRSGDPQ